MVHKIGKAAVLASPVAAEQPKWRPLTPKDLNESNDGGSSSFRGSTLDGVLKKLGYADGNVEGSVIDFLEVFKDEKLKDFPANNYAPCSKVYHFKGNERTKQMLNDAIKRKGGFRLAQLWWNMWDSISDSLFKSLPALVEKLYNPEGSFVADVLTKASFLRRSKQNEEFHRDFDNSPSYLSEYQVLFFGCKDSESQSAIPLTTVRWTRDMHEKYSELYEYGRMGSLHSQLAREKNAGETKGAIYDPTLFGYYDARDEFDDDGEDELPEYCGISELPEGYMKEWEDYKQLFDTATLGSEVDERHGEHGDFMIIPNFIFHAAPPCRKKDMWLVKVAVNQQKKNCLGCVC